MFFSPKALTWILRSYPPFFFQRIWVKKIHPGYVQADLKIYKSLLNINSNKTIFGGTMFSAVDPIHPILLDQIFQSRGHHKTIAWLKSAKIEYLSPAKKNLQFSIRLSEVEIEAALAELKARGKVVKIFEISIFDSDGLLCARSYNEVYIRDLTYKFPPRIREEKVLESH